MHVGSPDAARAQDVVSRWSRRARSWRRDGRSHRGRGARPTTAPVATSTTGGVSPVDAGATDAEGGVGDRWAKSWQPSSLSTMSSVFLSNSLYHLSLPTLSFLSVFLSFSCLFLSLPFSLFLSFSFSLLISIFSPLSLSPLLLSFSSLSGEEKERGRESERISENEREREE